MGSKKSVEEVAKKVSKQTKQALKSASEPTVCETREVAKAVEALDDE